MAGLIGIVLTIGSLILAVLKNIYIGFPLLLGYAYFTALNLIRGRSFAQIYDMSKEGAKKAFIVIPIILLIGCVVATWMAAGTVGALVYYSSSLISPFLFIFFAFILPSLISTLLGTSFGTVGTIGVILMVLARGGGVDPYITAGAIISGSFVGDRCSPMASLLYFLSSVTETDVYTNMKMLMKTTLLPYALSAVLFLIVSLNHPLLVGQSSLRQDIYDNFNIGFLAFVPAIIIIVLAACKTNVKISLLASAVCAALLAVFIQGMDAAELASTLLWGFHPGQENALAGIIQGGGMWGMVKTGIIMLVACSLAGVLEGAGMLDRLQKLLLQPCGRFVLYIKTMLIAMLGLVCGCTQVISVVITWRLMKRPYELCGLDKSELARDISFTSLPLAAAIPWNLAAMVPLATLGIKNARHTPYLFFPFLLSLCYGILYASGGRTKRRKT